MNLIEQLGLENGKKDLPTICVGDSVRVNYLIHEGEKERVQPFSGTVIAIRGRGIARSMLVRRLVQGEGVERVFPMHSPRVKEILVERRGRVRRAKLYYLRDRVGKKTRVNELLGERARRLAARDKENTASGEDSTPSDSPSPGKESQPVEV